jgi:hypothetical protein
MKRRTKATPKLDYTARILIALQHLNLAPGITPIRVMHDSWCPARQGRPPCRCTPNIVIETTSGRIAVLRDGSCRPMAALN